MHRRGIRYSLNLPVSLTLAHKKFHARSESISLGGILLSSALLVPEGSVVEVEVRVARLPQPGTYLCARGKVVQVRPKATGDFAVAIAFERPIEFGLENLKSGAELSLKDQQLKDTQFKAQQIKDKQQERPRFPPREKFVTTRGLSLASAWLTET
jgi:PilZ domain